MAFIIELPPERKRNMANDLLIKNGKVMLQDKIIEANIIINDGKISKITKSELDADKIINASRLFVLPGLIDSHVHFREPGKSYKEDWRTGTRAASAGGVTTVLDMPNNNPPTITKKNLEDKRKFAKKGIVDYGFHFGATRENLGEIKKGMRTASVKFYLGATTGDLLFPEDYLEPYLRKLSENNLTGTFHCENNELLQHYKDSRPDICELKSVLSVISLSNTVGCKSHICHISTEKALEVISEIKPENQKLSCEVTPHHLFMDESFVKNLKGFAKMNPPLRSKKDVSSLWGGHKQWIS